MPLTSTRELLAATTTGPSAVAAFNVITLEYAEAILTGAERAGRPVILQLSENATTFHGGNPRPLGRALAALSEVSTVPVSLHLDHVEDEGLLYAAADAGFSSVMFDAGRLPYVENVAATVRAVEWAHRHGLTVEAELGYVGGKDTQVSSAHAAGVRTEPAQAADFVAATGVDALAVAVGSSHAMRSRDAELDHELIARLRAAVPVPLVLHGSSGVADDTLRAAIAAGMRKINIGTILSIAFTSGVRSILAADPELTDPRKYLRAGRDQLADQVFALLAVVSP